MNQFRIVLSTLICFVFISLPINSQTVTTPIVSGGAIYQVAAAAGIQYIEPTVGQSMVTEKAAINWKNVGLQAVAVGSSSAVTAGITGIVAMGMKALTGLSIFHSVWDQFGQPLLSSQLPNPGNIAPVLLVSDSVAPSVASCIERSLYASAILGLPAATMAKYVKKGNALPRAIGPINISGVNVMFTPQPVGVVKNIAGSPIKKLIVISVVVCVPSAAIQTVPIQPLILTHDTVTNIESWDDTLAPQQLASMQTFHVENVVENVDAEKRAVEIAWQYPVADHVIDNQPAPVQPAAEKLAATPVPVDRALAKRLNLQGRALTAAGRYREAITTLRAATVADSTMKESWNALGFSLHLAGQEREALAAYDTAIELDAGYANANLNRSITVKALHLKGTK